MRFETCQHMDFEHNFGRELSYQYLVPGYEEIHMAYSATVNYISAVQLVVDQMLSRTQDMDQTLKLPLLLEIFFLVASVPACAGRVTQLELSVAFEDMVGSMFAVCLCK